ncbi:hypothetical protein SSP24_09180 [Streptomyces spinoverrucosus]|uniref:Hydroxyquinol 1,2-dioxygenase n=1 Tax=Streptomyces spinoverrucosus TaxID=284043 RepID=A0A4Y3VA65_9ACTN|nr:hydroxyquinol 1,2-dioxygenase [Streptomyces spinoverrucosus]GEC03263.1 hypothetical protein SSP24_09180 [Streptomyces spinoverrucosus]GHB37020.1 hypothetical protein GCM10010397_03380 [Streptomyces spinoverrucosus]
MGVSAIKGKEKSSYVTRFGSLENYEKGGVEIVNDDPRHYAFSNVFEVASNAKPYEKIAVGKNMEYVLEAIRAEGTSEWRTAAHDEFALVMDGEVEITLVKLDQSPLPADAEGSVALAGEPVGRRMGRVVARRGHMTLLPAGAAYRFSAERPGVILQQTIAGPDTQFRWAEIAQSL